MPEGKSDTSQSLQNSKVKLILALKIITKIKLETKSLSKTQIVSTINDVYTYAYSFSFVGVWYLVH